MRSPIESFAGRGPRFGLALILLSALAACGSHAGLTSAPAAPARANGPAADYPVVVGEPYKVGGTLYTPVDTMNYDEVGYAAVDPGRGITGSHHTLPLPSYVEVTSLASGHTILVRVERRGPMDGSAVIALSRAALAQLGAAAGEPVRVRRVNPPEEERAALRAGGNAPARMDTPASLLAVLKQKLPADGSTDLAPRKSAAPAALASVALPPNAAARTPSPTIAERAAPVQAPTAVHASARSAPPPLPPLSSRSAAVAPAPAAIARRERPQEPVDQPVPKAPAADEGAYIVQAATMSTIDRAQHVAGAIGGSVSRSGQYYRVRTGPFATRGQAEASLAKVRAAGYSDARIFTNG